MARTVLIVEDTDLCRDAIEVALMDIADVHVHCVETAEQALTSLENEDICAVITDLHLTSRAPSLKSLAMDGFELISALRRTQRYARLPVIVTSGDSNPATAARLEGLGVAAYFPKPYSPAAVRSRLEQLILSAEREAKRESPGGLAGGSPSVAKHSSSTASPPTAERKAG